MVPRGGIEPPTLRFSVACSTNLATWACPGAEQGAPVYSQAGRLCPPAFAFGYGVAGPALPRCPNSGKTRQICGFGGFPFAKRPGKPPPPPPVPPISPPVPSPLVTQGPI